MTTDDPFADFDEETTSQAMQSAPQDTEEKPRPAASNNGRNSYADEIFSRKIETEQRTFFIDLKQSERGKFLKISERSRGRKSTIIMDAQDIAEFTAVMEEVKKAL